ncbi:MAG: arsenate reductase ArsC [Legionellales bacterium]|jgi:arsenate reductase
MKILFLCVANSARSQMAEGIARYEFGDSVEVLSAGSQPTTLNPLAVKSLQEINIDIGHHQSKSIDAIDLKTIDLIITLCADEICPLVIGKQQKKNWPFPDPANPNLTRNEQIAKFSEVRDQLIEKIRGLKQELGIEPRNRIKAKM